MTRASLPSIDPTSTGRASLPPSSKEVEEILRPIRRVMAALMRSDALSRGDVDDALRQVTEVAAHVLAVARASVWVLEGGGSRIDCVDLFDARTQEHRSGASIPAVDAPAYFASLREARSIAAHDARTDPRTCEFAGAYLPEHGIVSMLDAPVLVRGQLAGIVCHEHCGEPRRWAFWEELVAGTLADFVAMVLGAAEHVQQAQELARYREGLEKLVEERTAALVQSRDTLRTLFESAPLPMVLTSLGDGTIRQCNERAAAMFELPMTRLVGAQARDFYFDPEARSAFLDGLRREGRVDAFTVQLVTGSGRPFWVLMSARLISVDGDPSFFVGFADLTAQKVLEEQLRGLASTDGLTGAMNRRSFDEVLAAEIARADRYAHPLSVAMIDADHFKRLNDRFGHAVGDDALRMLRRVLQGSLRRVDVLARYGGEEFVVLLPETDLEAATVVLERARTAVEAEPSVLAGSDATLTVSVGATAYRPKESLAELVERADEALYDAKQAGRNRLRAK